MKINLHYQRRRCSRMTLVFVSIRFMGIEKGASNDSGVDANGNFQYFRLLFLQKL